MCRLLGYCARPAVPVAGLVGDEGLSRFTALSDFHADGWGMGWYDGDRPRVRRSARRAGEDPQYARLARTALGDLRSGLRDGRSQRFALRLACVTTHAVARVKPARDSAAK